MRPADDGLVADGLLLSGRRDRLARIAGVGRRRVGRRRNVRVARRRVVRRWSVRVARRQVRVATTAADRLQVQGLRLRLVLDAAGELVDLVLELVVAGGRERLARRVARGERLAELALLEQRRAQVEEVFWLGHARDGVAELRRRVGVLVAVHQLLALVVLARGDVRLRFGEDGRRADTQRQRDGRKVAHHPALALRAAVFGHGCPSQARTDGAHTSALRTVGACAGASRACRRDLRHASRRMCDRARDRADVARPRDPSSASSRGCRARPRR